MHYTAIATVTGGRSGKATTVSPEMEFTTSTPQELGGSGEGVNPEQLFAVGWGACYQSAMMNAAKRLRINAMKIMKSKVRTFITLSDDAEGNYNISAKIEVFVPDMELDQVQELANLADEICPYSRATRGNVEKQVVAVQTLE